MNHEAQRSNYDHYIAQHYIKRFSDAEGNVFRGNIRTGTVEQLSDVSRILGEVNWSVLQEVEDSFSKIEGEVSNAFTSLSRDPDSIKNLSITTQMGLKKFIVMHYLRSPSHHHAINSSTAQLKDDLNKYAPTGFDIDKLGLREATRPESLMFGMETADAIEPIFEMKGCVALKAPEGMNFILGDYPLANISTQESFYMRGAIFAPQTYFWFPLNPKIGLFFGEGLHTRLGEKSVKTAFASGYAVNHLNRAEVFEAVESIVGNSKNFVRSKIRLPNVGEQRMRVERFGRTPIVFNINQCVYQMPIKVIEEIYSK